MHINLSLIPLIALICGILILVFPKFLRYIVATFLIIYGVLEMVGGINLNLG